MASASSSFSTSVPSDFVPRTVKTLLVGACGAGKTVFLTRHLTGEFEKRYIETEEVQTSSLKFPSTVGEIVFDIHDHPGSCIIDGRIKRNNYDAAIVMFDVTSRVSFKEANNYILIVRSRFPSIPIVLCGSKVDCVERKVKIIEISTSIRKNGVVFYDISAKSYYNFEKPFLSIVHSLIGSEINFVEREPLLPPEVTVTDEQIASWMEMAEASEE